jgi:glycosyltransferase involved in cell wall biosynthesis
LLIILSQIQILICKLFVQLIHYYQKKKCKVIYNLIDFDRWKPLPVFENRKITRLKLIIVASQIYLKNLTGLIEALVLLDKEELEKIEIEWYGDHITEPYYDSSFPEGKQKISEMNLEKVISFYPATNEITSKIQEADAVGLFSFVEGLPNVVCEAMACAKPVICSNVSDVPELLSFDKNLICDPTDSHSIKKSLSYLISLNKEQLIRIGYENLQTSLQRFAKEKIVSDYMKLLNK